MLFQNLCLMNVIYFFNFHYVSFLFLVSILDNRITKYLFNNNNNNSQPLIFEMITDSLGIFIIGFGTLIFCEMITINAFGLNEKTKVGLLMIEKDERSGQLNHMASIYYDEEESRRPSNKKIKNTTKTIAPKNPNNPNFTENSKKSNKSSFLQLKINM